MLQYYSLRRKVELTYVKCYNVTFYVKCYNVKFYVKFYNVTFYLKCYNVTCYVKCNNVTFYVGKPRKSYAKCSSMIFVTSL